MSALAVGLTLLRAVPSRVAERADWLYVLVVLRCVAKMVIVFMPPLAGTVDMAAVCTGQFIGMRPAARADVDVDPLPRLLLVAISRGIRRRPWPPGLWIHARLPSVVRPLDQGVLGHRQRPLNIASEMAEATRPTTSSR